MKSISRKEKSKAIDKLNFRLVSKYYLNQTDLTFATPETKSLFKMLKKEIDSGNSKIERTNSFLLLKLAHKTPCFLLLIGCNIATEVFLPSKTLIKTILPR